MKRPPFFRLPCFCFVFFLSASIAEEGPHQFRSAVCGSVCVCGTALCTGGAGSMAWSSTRAKLMWSLIFTIWKFLFDVSSSVTYVFIEWLTGPLLSASLSYSPKHPLAGIPNCWCSQDPAVFFFFFIMNWILFCRLCRAGKLTLISLVFLG